MIQTFQRNSDIIIISDIKSYHHEMISCFVIFIASFYTLNNLDDSYNLPNMYTNLLLVIILLQYICLMIKLDRTSYHDYVNVLCRCCARWGICYTLIWTGAYQCISGEWATITISMLHLYTISFCMFLSLLTYQYSAGVIKSNLFKFVIVPFLEYTIRLVNNQSARMPFLSTLSNYLTNITTPYRVKRVCQIMYKYLV